MRCHATTPHECPTSASPSARQMNWRENSDHTHTALHRSQNPPPPVVSYRTHDDRCVKLVSGSDCWCVRYLNLIRYCSIDDTRRRDRMRRMRVWEQAMANRMRETCPTRPTRVPLPPQTSHSPSHCEIRNEKTSSLHWLWLEKGKSLPRGLLIHSSPSATVEFGKPGGFYR